MKITDIDKLNADKFKNGADDGYICVMCEGSDISLDDSMSSHGYNLVCNRCYYRMLEVLNTSYLMDDIHKAGEYRRYIQIGKIELHPTPEQADKIKEIYKNGETHARLYNETESYSCIKSDKFNIRR